MPYMIENSNTYPPHLVDDDYWQPEWGGKYDKKLPYFNGCLVDSKFLPPSGYVEEGELTLAPFIPLPRWLCNEEVKDVIEMVEPDIHQFVPYAVRKSETDQEIVQNYFTINICNSLEVFNPNDTDPDLFKPSGNGFVIKGYQTSRKKADGLPINFSVYQHMMEDRHIVIDPRIGIGNLVLSDTAYDALLPYLKSEYFWAFKTV